MQSPTIIRDSLSNKSFRYFIPEWDDRVDPNYNFLTDEHTPNRDPYD
ncbi:MAG: hypothetical protein ACO3XI_14670 [bacterium]